MGGVVVMKRITFSADSVLIDLAREKAKRNHTTLAKEFRKWLDQFPESFETPADTNKNLEKSHNLKFNNSKG
jgi:hypothetical protein